ncbi:MAG TPA: hypothetical protein K8W17_04065 [Lapidilactobacillus dextrinicus]|uniref:Uncharacterized protein n=1 Tax=Lapidilactobacillus dextrinicus TaxID=51664 RepID=A0A921B305_9LACO|nr:hypothetical protein [Lapidilactobacillus dextrinicus]
MKNVNRRKRIYAIYRGEQNLADGTRDELAAKFNVKPKTISFWACPSYLKRLEKPGHNPDKSLIVVCIGFAGEDYGWKGEFR